MKSETEGEGEVIKIPVGKYFDRIKANPWIIFTFVLVIVLIVMFFIKPGSTGFAISEKDAGDKLVDFINKQGNGEAKFVSAEKSNGLYKITVEFNGQNIPVYMTPDGNNLVSDFIPINADALQDNSAQGDSLPANEEKKNVEEGDSPVFGNADAKVSIIEFSDYECPFCERFYTQTLPSLNENYIKNGKAKIVFKDFPLDFHPNAQKAAEATRCVREQKGDEGYFKMHDKLFENQKSLSLENYEKWAKEIGADEEKFDTCLTSGKFASAVQADLKYGQTFGVKGTPSFFINGRFLEGAQPYPVIQKVIDEELNK
ncbi:MAG: thioredoxin domain-containing protein [Nanoarchaeota archaeon]